VTGPGTLRAGLAAAVRNRRLALVVWAGLVLTAALALPAIVVLTSPVDGSPFRDTLAGGWDSWGIVSSLTLRPREWTFFAASAAAALGAGALLQLFLTGGILRVLVSGVPRPAFRRAVAEGAALFKPSLWAAVRWLLGLALWGGLWVALPLRLLSKLAGPDAPPNGGWTTLSHVWGVIASLTVYFLVTLKFDLARVAIARDDARTARAGYRAAKRRLKGARLRALGIVLFWTAAGLAIQALFTNLGVRMNPTTARGLAVLVAVRQAGFVLSAMARVGFWGSLLRFDETRREEDAPPRPVLSPLAAYPTGGAAPEAATT
jgi:hypothetical protein